MKAMGMGGSSLPLSEQQLFGRRWRRAPGIVLANVSPRILLLPGSNSAPKEGATAPGGKTVTVCLCCECQAAWKLSCVNVKVS